MCFQQLKIVLLQILNVFDVQQVVTHISWRTCNRWQAQRKKLHNLGSHHFQLAGSLWKTPIKILFHEREYGCSGVRTERAALFTLLPVMADWGGQRSESYPWSHVMIDVWKKNYKNIQQHKKKSEKQREESALPGSLGRAGWLLWTLRRSDACPRRR